VSGKVKTTSWWSGVDVLYGDMRHTYVSGGDYIYKWNPISDQTISSCGSRSYSLSYAGISYSGTANVCPDRTRMRIENSNDHGANFLNQWETSNVPQHPDYTRGVAGADTFRWVGPPYRGGFSFRIKIGSAASGLADKSCSGTNQTCS
jgi:hypothetical protein